MEGLGSAGPAFTQDKLLQGEKEAFLQVVSAFFKLLETLEKNSNSPPPAACLLQPLLSYSLK